jgi:hypothetical protein
VRYDLGLAHRVGKFDQIHVSVTVLGQDLDTHGIVSEADLGFTAKG